MKTTINGKEVDVRVTHETNYRGDQEVAFSVTINNWFVLEVTKAGKLRRCDCSVHGDNGLQTSRTHNRIKLEKGF